MRVLGILVKRELFDNLTSSRYVLTSVLCVALCVTSIVLMLEDYTYRQKRFNLSDNVSGMHHNLSHRQIFAKPPQPLSVMARGIDEVIGRTLHIAGLRSRKKNRSPMYSTITVKNITCSICLPFLTLSTSLVLYFLRLLYSSHLMSSAVKKKHTPFRYS